MYFTSISCMKIVVICFLPIATQLNCIHCFSHCCKKWGIPLFCSQCKFQFPLFPLTFTNYSSPTICFSAISIACTIRYCYSSSNVTGTVTAVTLEFVYCTLFCRITNSVLIVFSVDAKWALLKTSRWPQRFRYIWLNERISSFMMLVIVLYICRHLLNWALL